MRWSRPPDPGRTVLRESPPLEPSKGVYCATMVRIACSGFPVPVSRYWGELDAVEISDTELGMPGSGTVRRWLREAPEGFVFTILGQAAFGEAGFQLDAPLREQLEALRELASRLDAGAVVFRAPESFKATPQRRTALKRFVKQAAKGMPPLVLDLPGWKPAHVARAVEGKAVVAYDPLREEPPPPRDDLAYLRLPGPAGRRSRYDEEALQRLAEHCQELRSGRCFVVFRNIDMLVNAKHLLSLLEGA